MANSETMLSSEEEPDIELEVFEEPLDPRFPRFPNTVSRRGHRAIKIRVTVEGTETIPSTARSVAIVADINSYGNQRMGRNGYFFRHRLLWGTKTIIFPLPEDHTPTYSFDVVVERQLDDDHIGEGPYEALVSVTPSSESPAATNTVDDDTDPKVAINFVGI